MKAFVTAIALSIFCIATQAQIDFQPGYYIRNDGTKVSCLIKDYGWRNNPKNIVCKTSPDAAPVTIGQESITEFSVGNAKYQRFSIDVDTSAQGLEDLGKSWLSQYRHETAILRVLVEGKATLYVYHDGDRTKFYFKLNTATPQPLVFKQYMSEGGSIATNPGYIAQLFDSLACSSSNLPDPATLRYEAKAFVRYFIAYNTCMKSAYTDYWAKTGKTAIHLYIKPGLDLSSAKLTDISSGSTQTYNFGSQSSFRIAAELEIVLPFNGNKWAVVLEPAYLSYSGKTSSGVQLDYKAIQALLGARYFLIVAGPSKLYLTGSFYADIPANPTLIYENNAVQFNARFGASLSAGYRYNDRFGIELKYSIAQSLLDNYYYLRANLNTTSLSFSCRIL
jgi:hypothetical protein